MTARTLTATRPGPMAFLVDLPAGEIRVITDPSRTVAEVTVTARGDDPAVHEAVCDAVLRWDEPTGTLTVRVHPTAASVAFAGSTQTVTGVEIGGVVNLGGRVVIGGVEITGRGATGGRIEIIAKLPEGSSVAALTRSASLACLGEFAEVDFTSTAGDVSAGGVGALRAKTTSGDVSAAVVDGAAVVRSVSGDVHLGRADDVYAATTSGDVTVTDFAGRAEVSTVSGDIRIRATAGAAIAARSVSGDVTVTANGTALAEGLAVNATSRTGRVTTPTDTPPGAASASHVRQPRRTNGGA
ncbi:DUF4097 family beta strand repeat-containing protein [Actinomadura litoris]|uniref:DUF4097 family beta strand repeat protein n=1 Tax=Actinomadura litoris TaxID=2678616 RepID=A0A7K1KTI0_9ACTN|nr:DUF4097 family beta strand repeat-containing protein [Actinomadura litoris]MUN35482.1 DUF4097 family beta strand repeat protein [Actinomadura litoris]